VVHRIAAGEVIERPASILKELIENALDAGAQSIRVEAQEGGKRSLCVWDDGAGIHPEDMGLLFSSHATSKLKDIEGLFGIESFGFRGEALASIGAVAKVRIFSRPRGWIEGRVVSIEGGHKEEPKPFGCPEGTGVEVRNLFYNTPVRYKFLRSQDIEYSHLFEVLTRFAISHPNLRIDFFHNQRHELNLAPARDNLERISSFFGDELAGSLIRVESSIPPYTLKAYLAPPRFSRLNPRHEFIFLNNRFIRDRVLTRAIHEAYRELIPHGRYPVVFLFLEVAPGEVDINVHPTKIEVRFRQVWRLHDFILNTLREKLLQSELAPHVTPKDLGPSLREQTSKAIMDFFTGVSKERHLPPMETLPSGAPRFLQLHHTYIIEEVQDGIVIIDQHALHERYRYEELKKEFGSHELTRQYLLVPIILRLTPDERGLLEEHRSLIESIGLEFDDFGADSIAIRTVPVLLKEEDPAKLMQDILDMVSEAGNLERDKPFIEQALRLLACRSAVRAGDNLSPDELRYLLKIREQLEQDQTCVHGRPISIKLTLEDLQRLFRRDR
jgi:DNA mismatch repair protein MutL